MESPSQQPEARPRGRPRAFDLDEVLDRAVELFWTQGFEGASMSAIEDATGLNKSSIYNSFGSKEQLFTQALDRYVTARQDVFGVLRDGERGLDDIHDVLEAQRREALAPAGRRGCLAVNSLTERGMCDEAVVAAGAAFRAGLATGFGQALERAARLGEIDAAVIPRATTLLVSLSLAQAVLMRGGADKAALDAHIDAVHATVDSWRRSVGTADARGR